MDLVYESSGPVLQMHCRQELLYLGLAKEIMILSIRRKLRGKDYIKRRLPIQAPATQDKFTQKYNDNKKGQVDFVKFAIKDGQFPLVHSSRVEQRLITLNSENPSLQQFYLLDDSIFVLCNNGALFELGGQQVTPHQVKAFCIQGEFLAYYSRKTLFVIKPRDQSFKKEFKLKMKFKNELQLKGPNVLLHNTEGYICHVNVEDESVRYFEKQILHLELVSGSRLYYQEGNAIFESKLDLSKAVEVQRLPYLSKFTQIDGRLYFRNGMVGSLGQPLRSITSCCPSYNNLVHFVAGETQQSSIIICITYELTPQDVLQRIWKSPIDLHDLLVYLNRCDQYPQFLELLTRQAEMKKRRGGKQQQSTGGEIPSALAKKILISLLVLRHEKSQYEELYLMTYMQYLQELPESKEREMQIGHLQAKLSKRGAQLGALEEECPLCGEALVSWTQCRRHRFMRCDISQVPLKSQHVIRCKTCEFVAVKQEYGEEYNFDGKSCPVCGGRMQSLI